MVSSGVKNILTEAGIHFLHQCSITEPNQIMRMIGMTELV